MPAIACLIADPNRQPLDSDLVAAAGKQVGGSVRWLAEAEAAEIHIEGLDPAGVEARLAPVVANLPIDLAVVPATDRRKQLLLCDMDSTIITIECIDELADMAGIKPQIAAVTRRAMNGELDFPTALRERVALLAGLPRGAIDAVIRDRLQLMPGARTLVRTMHQNGAVTALVSGGFTAFTAHVRQLCGFDHDEANELEIENGELTGRLVGDLRGADAKLSALSRLQESHNLATGLTMAVGDGANDLPMLHAAGLGVAFRAHTRVREAAGVRIDHGDLTALLFLQGYSRQEFAAN
ncbi:MAG: phosphoserine phosphatase SerB [Geminicoccaceae bacterium]